MKAVLALAFVLCSCVAAAAASPFDQAVASYRAGRYADAYGRFTELASHGDADAARIALFMQRHGPILFGTYWDASPQELAAWQQVAASARGRADPVFVPLEQQDKSARRRAAVKQTVSAK